MELALYPHGHSVQPEGMMAATLIKGEKLTTWRVMPGGTEICLDFMAVDGGTHRVVFSVDTLSGLMMTLPSMLQSALDERFESGSFRIVQWLRNWHLEQQANGGGLILKLGTKDGFEINFALNNDHAGLLGAALLETQCDIDPTLVRRPN